jgi:hypothetical protein
LFIVGVISIRIFLHDYLGKMRKGFVHRRLFNKLINTKISKRCINDRYIEVEYSTYIGYYLLHT